MSPFLLPLLNLFLRKQKILLLKLCFYLFLDPESQAYIITLNGIKLISNYLLHKNEEISLNALTTLYYLFETRNQLIPPELKSTVIQYEASDNPRLKNLGTLFANTYFH